MMSRKFAHAVLCTTLSLGVVAFAEPSFTYTSIDVPGASSTSASGINARGAVVGAYVDTLGQHGFLLDDEGFTPIDYPGATATQARGINRRGDIVGTHQGPNLRTPGSGGDIHGFLLHKRDFTAVDYPGHMNTITQRITATGLILGCYHDHDTMGSMHGILISAKRRGETDDGERSDDSRTRFSFLDVPASMNNGGTPDAELVAGLYTDMMGQTHGYFLRDGDFRPFDVPGSVSTAAWDMNPSGDVVGVYMDASTKVHGFLLRDGAFVPIDYPGARTTQAFGINPRGNVVGTYVDATGKTHGFLLSGTGHRAE
jgi:probable HAF family extracellular repeat protein